MANLVNGVPRATFIGLEQVKQALDATERHLGANGYRRVLYAGAVVFRDAIRARAPVRTGALRKAIIVDTKRRGGGKKGPYYHVARVVFARRAYTLGKRGTAVALKRAKGQKIGTQIAGNIYPRKYAHLVEFGHGGPHPAPPRPFARPAIAASRGAAFAAMKARATKEVDAAIAKAAARSLKKLVRL
ncbi:MAG: HK97-gp10 family putative phage morphogenesis protein [Phycisphaerales bacterium]